MTGFIKAFRRFRAQLPASARLYVAGCSGAPLALAKALAQEPELAAGLTFLGVWIPGVNRVDWAGFHPDAQAETIFLSADLRPSFEAGRTRFLPLSYGQAVRWLETTPLDGAVVMTTPDVRGRVSLGVSADFSGIVLDRSDIPVFGLQNRHMPRPVASLDVPTERFHVSVPDETPLLTLPTAALNPAFTALASHVASLIEDGDTLQFGLGNVQQAVLEALQDRRALRLHAGMVSDPLLGLLDAGAIAEAPGAITTGVALGSTALYQRAAEDPRFAFKPVSQTHAITTLAAIPRLKAINSVISVDLFGQANAEFLGEQQISGSGGLVDFLRGAALSPGGRGVIALLSTAKGGAVSRITPQLDARAVSIARADVDTVITEHGVAHLKGCDIDARAEALIAIADPAHRPHLQDAWRTLRRHM